MRSTPLVLSPIATLARLAAPQRPAAPGRQALDTPVTVFLLTARLSASLGY